MPSKKYANYGRYGVYVYGEGEPRWDGDKLAQGVTAAKRISRDTGKTVTLFDHDVAHAHSEYRDGKQK